MRVLVLWLTVFLSCGGAVYAGKERVWDQDAAKKRLEKVLELEATRKQPWNAVPWHTDPKQALIEARDKRRPLLVFFFMEEDGPPLERCCLSGRLIRGLVLSEESIRKKITRSFVPLKLVYSEGKNFGVNWALLNRWETKFKFSSRDGCAGCAVLNADLTMEFTNTGSSMLGELFDSVAYDPKKFSRMLSRGYQRWKEDGLMGREGGLSMKERKTEVERYRRGVAFEVEREGEMRLPPEGYSLEKVLELLRMAGVKTK